MEYEKKREVSIKIIEVVREWCEENGLEASPHAEAEIAEEIILQVIMPLQQKPTVTLKEIENAVGDTSDEYTKGVIELFESNGFEIS